MRSAASRRAFLRAAGGLALGSAFGACRSSRADPEPSLERDPTFELGPAQSGGPTVEAPAAEPAPLDPVADRFPTPDLSDARILRFVAGLRPYRRGGVRLAAEELGRHVVVHNYGHGGSGITLAWGCADEVLQLVHARANPPESIGVLGGGVSGLTCAHRLASAGFRVRVLAREFTPRTTSDIAGGQFAPSLCDPGSPARFERWLRGSHAAYTRLQGERYGVARRPNFTTLRAGSGLRRLPTDLFAPSRRLERLPFEGVEEPGEVYETFLVEPPRLLAALTEDLIAMRVVFQQGELATRADALAQPERLLINTLGLGAARVFGDADLSPIRGQLVLMEPQALPYLLSHSGYLFPRADAVVLGGTVERGVADATADPARCRSILARHRRFFGLSS